MFPPSFNPISFSPVIAYPPQGAALGCCYPVRGMKQTEWNAERLSGWKRTPPHKMKKFRSNAQEDIRMQTHDHTFLFLHPFCSLSVLPHGHTRRNRHLIHQSACIKHEIRAAESVICSVTLRPNSLFLLLFYDQTRLCPGRPGGF